MPFTFIFFLVLKIRKFLVLLPKLQKCPFFHMPQNESCQTKDLIKRRKKHQNNHVKKLILWSYLHVRIQEFRGKL